MKLDISNVDFANVSEDKNFDQSFLTRYVLVTELVNDYRRQTNRKSLRILDLGGYNGMARQLLPNEKITILDVFEDEALEDYIQVDSVGIPQADDSFDVTISTDVLEHIPADQREHFIREALRVTKGLVIIAAPFEYGPLAKEEMIANEIHKGQTKQEYIWLKEHRDYGLPEKAWMEKLLTKNGASYASFCQADIRVWSELLTAGYFIANNISAADKRLAKKLNQLNELYKKQFAKYDFPVLGYRTYFVIHKQQGVIEVKVPKYDALKADEFLSVIRRSLGATIADMSQRLSKTRSQLEEHKKVVEDLREQLETQSRQLNSRRHRAVNKAVDAAYKLRPPRSA